MSINMGTKHGQSAWCMYCGWATLLTGALFLAGCADEKKPLREYTPDDKKAEEKGLKEAAHDHDHGHGAGPHEGHLIELGKHVYHAEVVFDTASRKTTVYILGADAKTPLPIAGDAVQFDLEEEGKDELELKMTAAPLEGEPEGKSSRFEVAGDALPADIKSEEDFEGHLHIKIEDKEFEGELHHGEHGHEHADDHEEGEKKTPDDEHKDDEKSDTETNEESKKDDSVGVRAIRGNVAA